jgi:hypothetical protein
MNSADDSSIPVHEGGCLCGAVRYRAVGSPLAVVICHCANCQRNTSSAFSVNCLFPKGALSITRGVPSIYEDKGDSGKSVIRVFCGICGSALESRSVFSTDYAVIKAGTFDDPGQFIPGTEVYCRSAVPWWIKGTDRKCYEVVSD